MPVPDGFSENQDGICIRGDFISTGLIGNIHSFLKEYKKWDSGSIGLFVSSLDSDPSGFLKDFVADFSFVRIHTGSTILAARDHFGIFPLYYYQDANCLAISNDQRLITDIPDLDLSPDYLWMGDFITGSYSYPEATFYKCIRKIPPAHFLNYADGNLTFQKYWEPDLKMRQPEKPDEVYIAEFRNFLQQAVECRIPDDVYIGSEVSGGIDSPSVAAIAKSYLDRKNRPLFTYSHAAVDSENFPCEKQAIEKYLEFLKPFKHTFAPKVIRGMRHVMDHAFSLENGVAQSHFAAFSKDIYESAKSDGVKIILSGHGGDHGVSYRGSFAIIQDHIVKGNWKRAFREIQLVNKTTFHSFLVFIYQWTRILFHIGKEKRVNEEMDQGNIKALEAMKKKYPGLEQYQYNERKAFSTYRDIRLRLYESLTENELTLRTEATTIAAAYFGVIYRYPLLDIRLIQYFISLPPRMYYQNGINRYIFRKVIGKWIPEAIAGQGKPLINMYGWIMEAYKYDYEHEIGYNFKPGSAETEFYLHFWKYRDEQTREGDLFKKTCL